MMKIKFNLWILFVSFLKVLNSAHQNFTGHKLIGMVPRNPGQVEVLRHFMDDPEVDFWKEPTRAMENVTMHLPPDTAGVVEGTLKNIGLEFYTITDNLQTWIEREREENTPGEYLAGRDAGFAFDVYHPLDEITAYLKGVTEKHTEFTSLVDLGDTFEGNVIHALKISTGGNDTRSAVWIDAGIHSREWVAPATALYIVNQLISNYGSDKKVTRLLDTYDWYIAPLVNPDGYLHTWNWNRLWRKNRAIAPNFPGVIICRGADPNRNFDVHFGGASTSSTPCSSIYKGNRPFSEAESSAIRDGVTSIKDRLKAYFTLHSFSQLWMSPRGYTAIRPPDYKDHMELLEVAVSAVEAQHGMPYKFGPSAETLYPTSGSASDWAYDVAGVKYSFSIELRDTGMFGFLLPRSEILPTAEETWAGIEAAMLHIVLIFLYKNSLYFTLEIQLI